jgi:hypothetical protein
MRWQAPTVGYCLTVLFGKLQNFDNKNKGYETGWSFMDRRHCFLKTRHMCLNEFHCNSITGYFHPNSFDLLHCQEFLYCQFLFHGFFTTPQILRFIDSDSEAFLLSTKFAVMQCRKGDK